MDKTHWNKTAQKSSPENLSLRSTERPIFLLSQDQNPFPHFNVGKSSKDPQKLISRLVATLNRGIDIRFFHQYGTENYFLFLFFNFQVCLQYITHIYNAYLHYITIQYLTLNCQQQYMYLTISTIVIRRCR